VGAAGRFLVEMITVTHDNTLFKEGRESHERHRGTFFFFLALPGLVATLWIFNLHYGMWDF